MSGSPNPRGRGALFAASILAVACTARPAASAEPSAARLWNEQLLDAIRHDTPRPTVHARNLFHVSGAMYDAWSAYDDASSGYLFDESLTGSDADRNAAVSFAAYRVIEARYANSPGAVSTLASLDAQMIALGLDPTDTSTLGTTGAAVGNRAAAAYLGFGLTDGSNEQNNYADTSGYASANPPMVVGSPGTTMADPDRWQPLEINGNVQRFVTPHWGDVKTFAVERPGLGGPYGSDLVGPPPAFGTDDFKSSALEVLRYSSRLDPDQGPTINISPSVTGNSRLGFNDGIGHVVNPATGLPYADNLVNRGDWGRVLAEFWADGPTSATPPGHWNEIANEVSDSPFLVKQIGGTGPVVGDLEWDVKLYFTLNAAMHDSAVSAWDAKVQVDYARPISMIRELAGRGQSSDPSLPSYDVNGLPLEPGLVEVVTADTAAPGGKHEGFDVGTIVSFSWLGHDEGGVGWIDARTWLPYQAKGFVTPAFAGYVSGHSTFSRASAEVLADFTGDEYFPGGIGQFLFERNRGLDFEEGPSEDILLQWATYADAADEAGLSRLYGGIHVRADDFDGRVMGNFIGNLAWERAQTYYGIASTVPEPTMLAALVGATLLTRRRGPYDMA